MQSFLTTLVAVLAASSIAVPVSMMSRQLGGLGGLGSATAPVTTILGEVTKYLPGGKDKDKPKPKTNGTQPTTQPSTKPKSSDPLGGLGGLTGGLGI